MIGLAVPEMSGLFRKPPAWRKSEHLPANFSADPARVIRIRYMCNRGCNRRSASGITVRQAENNRISSCIPAGFVAWHTVRDRNIFSPLPYCFTHPETYYFRPVEPLIVILATVTLAGGSKRTRLLPVPPNPV